MPIQVTCPGCHTRFNVSEKFAGQSGACPKCKGPISVPAASDEVVVHEPEFEAGAKDAKGRHVLKTVKKADAKFNPLLTAAAACLVVLSLVVALALRGTGPESPMFWPIMIAGSLLVGPPLAWAGYLFLRDDELEGYEGTALAVRTLACSAGYAILWGVYAFIYWCLYVDDPMDVWMVFPLLPILAAGAGVAYVCYDLDLGSGFFHYSLYVATTIVLRLVMGLPALGPAASEGGGGVAIVSDLFFAVTIWL